MTLRVAVDSESCIGTGNCVFSAPGVFEQDDDGIARVIDPAAAPADAIRFAAGACPVSAIALADAGDQQ